MKHLLSLITLIAVAFLAVSCGKDSITPEELFKDNSKEAKVTIISKGGETENTVTTFSDVFVYRKSDIEGQSWFHGSSGGIKVGDLFYLDFYFASVDNMKVGDALKISRFMFTFPASSDGRASTESYTGKITLADKGDDHVILHFHNVEWSCLFGDYLVDGYLYCPLYDEYEARPW